MSADGGLAVVVACASLRAIAQRRWQAAWQVLHTRDSLSYALVSVGLEGRLGLVVFAFVGGEGG